MSVYEEILLKSNAWRIPQVIGEVRSLPYSGGNGLLDSVVLDVSSIDRLELNGCSLFVKMFPSSAQILTFGGVDGFVAVKRCYWRVFSADQLTLIDIFAASYLETTMLILLLQRLPHFETLLPKLRVKGLDWVTASHHKRVLWFKLRPEFCRAAELNPGCLKNRVLGIFASLLDARFVKNLNPAWVFIPIQTMLYSGWIDRLADA